MGNDRLCICGMWAMWRMTLPVQAGVPQRPHLYRRNARRGTTMAGLRCDRRLPPGCVSGYQDLRAGGHDDATKAITESVCRPLSHASRSAAERRLPAA